MVVRPPTYPTTCPECGAQLVPVALDPQTAPWLCETSMLGFWATDLSPANRAHWGKRGFTLGHHTALMHSARQDERLTAEANGISLREDQLGSATLATLRSALLSPTIAPSFAAQIKTQITNMGA